MVFFGEFGSNIDSLDTKRCEIHFPMRYTSLIINLIYIENCIQLFLNIAQICLKIENRSNLLLLVNFIV